MLHCYLIIIITLDDLKCFDLFKENVISNFFLLNFAARYDTEVFLTSHSHTCTAFHII